MSESSSVLSNLSSGVLYQNPKPHAKSVHAYFPSVVSLPKSRMLATYALGEAFEAANLRTHWASSDDAGLTWRHEGRIYPGTSDRIMSDFGRLAIAPDGELIANLQRHDRTDHPNEGLTNPANMGFVPTEFLIVRSSDSGKTWQEPAIIKPPLVGPCFEICSPIVFLRDGRWLLPTSTWLDWEGNLPNGNRMVAFVSEDCGKSWPTYLDVMNSHENNLIFWESKITELQDGRLLAVAWCYDQRANCDRANQYAISNDGGKTWSPPRSTGLLGQTLTPCLLSDGRLLCVYRRMDQPGLWANISRFEGDTWINEASQPLWGHRGAEGITSLQENMVHTFHKLRFGAPSIARFDDGSVFVAFWCYEDNISIIRWFRFEIL